jgi:hypothetical protein
MNFTVEMGRLRGEIRELMKDVAELDAGFEELTHKMDTVEKCAALALKLARHVHSLAQKAIPGKPRKPQRKQH